MVVDGGFLFYFLYGCLITYRSQKLIFIPGAPFLLLGWNTGSPFLTAECRNFSLPQSA